MPEISRFLGIVIRMFFNDHPPPHFHVEYQEFEAKIDLERFELVEGELPNRIRALVVRWAELHRDELMENWLRREQKKQLQKINPL